MPNFKHESNPGTTPVFEGTCILKHILNKVQNNYGLVQIDIFTETWIPFISLNVPHSNMGILRKNFF